MNHYIIRGISNYTEHYSDNWSVGYNGSEDETYTLSILQKTLEPHQKIVSVEKTDKATFDEYFQN
jgi:translation elongation factor EF-1alpha